jgi:hypothetical protein
MTSAGFRTMKKPNPSKVLFDLSWTDGVNVGKFHRSFVLRNSHASAAPSTMFFWSDQYPWRLGHLKLIFLGWVQTLVDSHPFTDMDAKICYMSTIFTYIYKYWSITRWFLFSPATTARFSDQNRAPTPFCGIPSSRLQQHGLCGTGQNFHVDPGLKNCQIVRIYENMIEYGCYLNDLELSTSPIQQDT